MEKRIYLDNAATTYVSNEVLNEMLPVFTSIFGNSSSLHSFGRDASALVDKSRDRVAKAINASSNEVFFTSGGTEANNWAILGIARANRKKGNHIIVSSIEHHSVLDACAQLEKEGFKITYAKVDEFGIVSLADIMHNITKDTILISVMTVNNEVGTVQNIKAIAKTAKENGIIFHTDAVQGLGAVKLDVKDMDIDAMSISAHKIYGPKGVGALFIRNGIRIESIIHGGNQEKGKRGGTTNVAGVVGFGKACEIAIRDMAVNQQKLKVIKDYFISEVTKKIQYIKVNGHPQQRISGTVNISFEMIEGESILLRLDLEGIAVSTGSACTSGSLKPSHVLEAMNVPIETAQGSIRFSFPKSISKEDIDFTIEKLVGIIEKLRSWSPITKAGRGKKDVH
ncbi:MAG: cysteine desulfurase NifS [Clostridia bacterium]